MPEVAVDQRVPVKASLHATYSRVDYDVRNGLPRLRFTIDNRSGSPWSRHDEVRLSYQVFDPESAVLLMEGERRALAEQLAAGESRSFEIDIQLPLEPGNYRVHCSLMQENVAWGHELGLPFIFAEVRVRPALDPLIERLYVTDRRMLTRSRLRRQLGRVFWLPFATLWRNRGLSSTLVRREILSRSKGSFGGSLWPILNPLLLMLTYFFVFGLVLRSRFEDDPSPVSFALYLLAGMIPWLAFSEAAGRAPIVMFEYRQLIKKLVFPIETLPVNLVYSGLVGEAFTVVLFTLGVWLIRGHLPATVLYLPAILVPQFLFTAGVSWLLAIGGAYFRDLAQVNGFLLTVWFFITPICYPGKQFDQLPAQARRLLDLNPIYTFVKSYRAVFLQGRAPDWQALGWLTVVSLALFLMAHALFYRIRKSFADFL